MVLHGAEPEETRKIFLGDGTGGDAKEAEHVKQFVKDLDDDSMGVLGIRYAFATTRSVLAKRMLAEEWLKRAPPGPSPTALPAPLPAICERSFSYALGVDAQVPDYVMRAGSPCRLWFASLPVADAKTIRKTLGR